MPRKKDEKLHAFGPYNYFASKADIVKGIVDEERADITMLEERLKPKKLARMAERSVLRLLT